MTEQQAAPLRGPIQIDFDLSESHPVAGTKFTLSVRVQNPFDVSVDVSAVRILVPSGLKFLAKDRGLDIKKDKAKQGSLENSKNEIKESNLSGEEEIRLAPNDILIHNFHLQTESWLFSTPKEYELSAAVLYVVDGRTHRQALSVRFSTRTRVMAPIIGAVVGSLMGSFAKTFSAAEISDVSWSKMTIQSIVPVILGIVATVIAVRRLGTQPVITVEDIYGGLILGFFLGYLGKDFFDTFYR